MQASCTPAGACQDRPQGRGLISAPTEGFRQHPRGGVLCRLKNGFPTEGGVGGINKTDKIIGEDQRAPEEEVPNGGIIGWFGTLFARPASVRLAIDGLAKFELHWRWYLGKGGRRGAVRGLHAKKRRNRFSRGSGQRNGGSGGRVGRTDGPLAGGRGEPWPSGESRGGDWLFSRRWRRVRAAETVIDDRPGGTSGGGLAPACPCRKRSDGTREGGRA